MTEVFKQFIFSSLLILCISAVSNAAVLSIENNSNLPLQINKKNRSRAEKKFDLLGYISPHTHKQFNITKARWEIEIIPALPSISAERYPTLVKRISFYNRKEVKSMVLSNEDFSESEITGTFCDPTKSGKYYNFLMKIEVLQDRSQHGSCYDFGEWDWEGGDYKGYKNLPEGHWVYVYPDWYIWGNVRKPEPDAVLVDGCDPTFNGKYYGEVGRIAVPEDREKYNFCYDYGPRTVTEYRGHADLPDGYWVYDYPEWVIYRGTRE